MLYQLLGELSLHVAEDTTRYDDLKASEKSPRPADQRAEAGQSSFQLGEWLIQDPSLKLL